MKSMILKIAEWFMYRSIIASSGCRGFSDLMKRLETTVPDNEKQYTSFEIPKDNVYLSTKLRAQHAFQMNLWMDAVALAKKHQVTHDKVKLADIGDSSGTHTIYLKSLLQDPQSVDVKSVNLDPVAIEKIRKRGLEALHCRAENLQHDHGFSADVFSAFEVVEHLMDPIRFLREIAVRTGCKYFVITVPLLHKSRMGLQYLKFGVKGPVYAENTHIFELSPADWRLLFRFSGWKIIKEDLYYQYPKWHPLWLTKFIWRRLDVDGFYGVILERDLSASDQYQSW